MKKTEKERALAAMVARSNALKAREELLEELLRDIRKARRALEPQCPHPIELVQFHTLVPMDGSIRGNCEICGKWVYNTDYSKRDRARVSFVFKD
jgi:hypothetical protein